MGKHPKKKHSETKKSEPSIPLLKKLSSIDAEERARSCASLGNLLLHPSEEDQVRLMLLKNNVIGKLIQSLSDSSMEVVLEAAGALHSALIGESEPDGLLTDMFRKDILTPLLGLVPKVRQELRNLLHPPPQDEMDVDEDDKKKKKKKEKLATAMLDSFKLHTRLAQQITALLQALTEVSDTLSDKHTPLRIISLNSHVIPFLVDLADGFKSNSKMSVPAEVSQLALQTLLTLVQDNDDASDLILSSGTTNNTVEKLFDLVSTKKSTHDSEKDWSAEDVDWEAKRLLSASVLYQVVFSDLKKTAMDESDMLQSIVRVTSKALDPKSLQHDVNTGETLVTNLLSKDKPFKDIEAMERLMEAMELRHVALELVVNMCAEKEKPRQPRLPPPEPSQEEMEEEFRSVEQMDDEESEEEELEEQIQDASVVGLIRHNNLVANITQFIEIANVSINRLDQALDSRQFAVTLIKLEDEEDVEEDIASGPALAKLVLDYRSVLSGVFARSLAALHNILSIQPKAFFENMEPFWTSMMYLLRESFRDLGSEDTHVAALLKDDEEWSEVQAAILGSLWKLMQKTHDSTDPGLKPSPEDVDFLLQVLTRASEVHVQNQTCAILSIIAQQQGKEKEEQNRLIGTCMVEMLEGFSKLPALEPDQLTLISELCNALFDIYADKAFTYDVVFRKGNFASRLETAYHALKKMTKQVDGRKWADERWQVDEAMMNLKSFYVYKQHELKK